MLSAMFWMLKFGVLSRPYLHDRLITGYDENLIMAFFSCILIDNQNQFVILCDGSYPEKN